MTQTLSRRHFLNRSGQALFAGLATGCVDNAPQVQEGRASTPAAAPTQTHELRAGWLETSLDGTPVKLRAWNGSVPGPLIEARPGDVVEVEIHNDLTPYDSSAWRGDHNVPHDLNSTNLHVHGLEVAPHLFDPLGTSDPLAPMISVAPGESKRYRFEIPTDQPPGLFWYHPHKHGSTAVQAVSGMAGAIIIRGNIDEVPEIASAKEYLLTVQDIGLFPTDHPERDGADTWIYEPIQNAIWQTFGGDVTIDGVKQPQLKGGFTTGDYPLRYFLMNGKPFYKETHNPANPGSPEGSTIESGIPVFDMAPGEVARFRLLNANSDDVMPVYLQGNDLHLIGMDGVNLPRLRSYPALPTTAAPTDYQVLLAPANRAEFLVQIERDAREGTIYELRQAPQSLQFLQSEGRVLARIRVGGPPVAMSLPAKLPVQHRHFPLTPDSAVSKTRYITFGMEFRGKLNPTVGLDFMINNQLYDALAVPQVVLRDAVEDWIIGAPGSPTHAPSGTTPGHQDNTEGHPFHIHVNSFEVIGEADVAPDGTVSSEVRYPEDQVLIQDTVWVPMGKQITIRQTFKQWTGKAVYHCHILPHEDTGMMQNLLIVDSHDGSIHQHS